MRDNKGDVSAQMTPATTHVIAKPDMTLEAAALKLAPAKRGGGGRGGGGGAAPAAAASQLKLPTGCSVVTSLWITESMASVSEEGRWAGREGGAVRAEMGW